jgi:hypothetical protein
MLNQIPQANQNLAQTQVPILSNFSTIDSVFTVDHQDYGTTNQGKHNKVTLPLQSEAPTFLTGEFGLYNFTYSALGSEELFLVFPDGGQIPLTAGDRSNNGPFSGGNGWAYLPSALKQTWGVATITTGSITITFASAPGGGIATFPGFLGDGSGNFVGFFNLTPMNATPPTISFPVLSAITLTGMTVTSSNGNNLTFMWNVTGL